MWRHQPRLTSFECTGSSGTAKVLATTLPYPTPTISVRIALSLSLSLSQSPSWIFLFLVGLYGWQRGKKWAGCDDDNKDDSDWKRRRRHEYLQKIGRQSAKVLWLRLMPFAFIAHDSIERHLKPTKNEAHARTHSHTHPSLRDGARQITSQSIRKRQISIIKIIRFMAHIK